MVSSVQPQVVLTPTQATQKSAGATAPAAAPAVASPAPSAGSAVSAGQTSQDMTGMILQLLMLTLQLAMQSLTGQSQAPAAPSTAATPTPAAPSTSAGNNIAIAPSGLSASSASPSATAGSTAANGTVSAADEAAIQKLSSDPQIQASLRQGAGTQEGRILLENAAKNGVKIQAGDPATAQGANDTVVPCNCAACQAAAAAGGAQQDAGVVVNGVTLTNGNSTRIVVRDPSNVKTLFHELVHANTTQDGDSKEEEGIADVIGSRVANAVGGNGGLSGTDQQIYLNKQLNYPGLQQTNNVRQDLALLGISVDV